MIIHPLCPDCGRIPCAQCGECHKCNNRICFFVVQEELRELFETAIEEHNYALAIEIERLADKLDFNLTGE